MAALTLASALPAVSLLLPAAASSARSGSAAANPLVPQSETRLLRVEADLAPDARTRPQIVLMTVGGPVYCMQLANLARHLGASRLCADYGPNGYEGEGGRAARKEDWGDPAYLDAVAQLPDRLRRSGVKIAKLVLVGVSYSGYADAELVATHPQLRPDALVVIDSYLDLPARYEALPLQHETRKEIDAVIGGTLAQRPAAYAARSPSHHLAGLAEAIRNGMRFVDVWSVSPAEQREFRGATCSRAANAEWLGQLANRLSRPVVGYVTEMRHAHALWDRGRDVLALAGVGRGLKGLPARVVAFRPHTPVPTGSYCS